MSDALISILVFTFTLLTILNSFCVVQCSIAIYDQRNFTLLTLDDTTANFGPLLPDDGFKGYIAIANPIGACSAIASPPNVSYVQPKEWIALVQRTPYSFGNNCSFDVKVYNAQKAGFSAVIVFNSESDNLIKMSSSGRFGVHIPSVFIGHSDGMDIINSYTYINKTYVIIDDDDKDLNYLMVPFIIVVSICFLIAIVLFAVKFVLHCHKMRKNRFPKSALKNIPTKKYQKTDKYDTCPICLNEYEEGVKMRILPCEHAYHIECIDKWLLRNNRHCPVCKRRVLPGESDTESEDGSITDAAPTTINQSEEASGEGNSNGANNEDVIENEANEDEYTDESSRLLVRSNVSRSVMPSASSHNENFSYADEIINMPDDPENVSINSKRSKSSHYGSICSSNNKVSIENETNSTDRPSSSIIQSDSKLSIINKFSLDDKLTNESDSRKSPEFFTPNNSSVGSSASAGATLASTSSSYTLKNKSNEEEENAEELHVSSPIRKKLKKKVKQSKSDDTLLDISNSAGAGAGASADTTDKLSKKTIIKKKDNASHLSSSSSIDQFHTFVDESNLNDDNVKLVQPDQHATSGKKSNASLVKKNEKEA